MGLARRNAGLFCTYKYCSVDALKCGNGSGRTQRPAKLLGDDWYLYGDWGLEVETEPSKEQAD